MLRQLVLAACLFLSTVLSMKRAAEIDSREIFIFDEDIFKPWYFEDFDFEASCEPIKRRKSALFSTLVEAIKSNDLEGVRKILLNNETLVAAYNNKAVRTALKCGHLDIAKALNKEYHADYADNNGSALKKACKRGDNQVVHFLLEGEQNFNLGCYGSDALKLAYNEGFLAIVRALLRDYRVDPTGILDDALARRDTAALILLLANPNVNVDYIYEYLTWSLDLFIYDFEAGISISNFVYFNYHLIQSAREGDCLILSTSHQYDWLAFEAILECAISGNHRYLERLLKKAVLSTIEISEDELSNLYEMAQRINFFNLKDIFGILLGFAVFSDLTRSLLPDDVINHIKEYMV